MNPEKVVSMSFSLKSIPLHDSFLKLGDGRAIIIAEVHNHENETYAGFPPKWADDISVSCSS